MKEWFKVLIEYQIAALTIIPFAFSYALLVLFFEIYPAVAAFIVGPLAFFTTVWTTNKWRGRP